VCIVLALTTSARIGELLALRWEHCQDGYVTFWETKNGKARRIPISPAIAAVLAAQPGIYPSVLANSRTGQPLTPNGVAHAFDRAVGRAGITTGDVTLHTLQIGMGM
jgi:integrase